MSMHQNLEDAICLLALISDRPPGLKAPTQEMEPSDIDRVLESYPNDEEFKDPKDPTVLIQRVNNTASSLKTNSSTDLPKL
ncbi:hypothetical protein N7537_010301 [Penicillium hordei]|uniref:Uncharacterized protein n=1 Tax=Penicillium hordei TaxID=40994 RepID=A0AAD6DVW4_9EURO|nr:uncharacterized protein N7537_010301 [Penicillium hordei]KAJ5593397.1 hypothetical protein N7537_010301 [Penicillium hordei]